MFLTNKEIASIFRLGAKLLEVKGENKFKIRSYENAAFNIEKIEKPLSTIDSEEIGSINGIGENILKKIIQILDHGSYDELDRLLNEIPSGIIELIKVRGISASKVGIAYRELNIESGEELLALAREGKLKPLKGFGAKTEEKLKGALEYYLDNKNYYLFAVAEAEAQALLDLIENAGIVSDLSITGELRRNEPIVQRIEILVNVKSEGLLMDFLNHCALVQNADDSDPFNTMWLTSGSGIPVILHFANEKTWAHKLLVTTGPEKFLEKFPGLLKKGEETEENLFKISGISYLPPDLRNSFWLDNPPTEEKIQARVESRDIKGCLHNHSTYSDGKNTLEEMAKACMEKGFEYFGISDHSQSAFYANGLKEVTLRKQWKEIEALNTKLSPFRIFKGIESDILNNGDLDYPDSILKEFDFIVASVHSQLDMDEKKATARLIKAIENPYTNILGHPTGRLLLQRKGYPVDYRKIIDACAGNNVIIEINANPRRLDIDWKALDYMMEKEVMTSINPDAHFIEGIDDMYYGLLMARKGCVPAKMVLNTLGVTEVEKIFKSKR